METLHDYKRTEWGGGSRNKKQR